jgi:hypothetical protein
LASASATLGAGAPDDATSVVNRLVEAALDLSANCGCAGPPRIHVLRGFGRESRGLANQVRAQLRRHGEVTICEEAMPVATLEFKPVEHHVCVFVAVSRPVGEAERIAALNEVPIVVPGAENAPSRQTSYVDEDAPVLLAASDLRPETAVVAFPSASGRVPHAALESYEIVPNQPEQGDLTLYLGSGTGQLLATGSTVKVRPLPDASIVEATDPQGASSTWLCETVEIRQRAGIYRIFRDGLSVADLPKSLKIHHRSLGLRRRLV